MRALLRLLLLLSVVLHYTAVSMEAAPAFDATSAHPTGGTGDLSWSHVPVGTPRAIIFFAMQGTSATDEVTSVTYGGVSMAEVSGSPNMLTGGEIGGVHVFFLGASIPTGTQTVSVTTSGATVTYFPSVISLTAADDTETVDVDATVNSTSLANPSVTLSLSGRTSWAGIAFYSGQNSPAGVTPLTDWTDNGEGDLGTELIASYYYNTVGTSDVTAGWTQAAEDAAMIAFAVAEVVVGGATECRNLALLGVGGACSE